MDHQASDDELRRDIDLFTALLGEVLREHSPKRVLVMVERLREGFARLRDARAFENALLDVRSLVRMTVVRPRP